MRYGRTLKKQSVTELFSRTRAPDRSVQSLSVPDANRSSGGLPCRPDTKGGSHRRAKEEVKPCSVLLSRLSDEGIARLLGGSYPKRAFRLHDGSRANGLSTDLEAPLALSTDRKKECDGHVQDQAKARRDPSEVRYSKEMSDVKEATTLKGSPVLTELKVASAEPDKSEELADIINFLIETDPKRNKEASISRGTNLPVIKEKTAGAECPREVQEHVSTSQKLLAANSEQARDFVADCASYSVASNCDLASQSTERNDEEFPHSRHVKDAPASAVETARCPNHAGVRRPEPSIVTQLNSDGARIEEKPAVDFVLPAPDIYGFTYEPELNAQSVSGLSSPDSVPSQAAKTKFAHHQAKVFSESTAMGVVDSPEKTSLSAGDQASDQNRGSEVLHVDAKNEAAYSTSTRKAFDLEVRSVPPKTMNLDTLRPSSILEEASDSRLNSLEALLVTEDKNDACPDTDKLATSSPPTYHDTRSCREKDDSCGGARRNGEALGDDQLRTAARPDVDTELASAPEAPVFHNKTGSDLKCASSEADSVEKNTLPLPDQDVSAQTNSASKSESLPEEATRKESDAESDDTEALEWAPYTVLTPCNSTENSREAGFKDDEEGDTDAGQGSEVADCHHELSSADAKEDSGIPGGKVMSDGATSDEAFTAEHAEPRGKLLNLPNLISVFTKIQEGKIVSVDCKKFRKRDRSCGSMGPPSKKLVLEKQRLTNGSLNRNTGEDVDTVVGEVLRDIIEKTVNGSSGQLGEKISTENLKHLFQTFCENNGYRYQDFVSDEVGVNFSQLFAEPLAEMQDIAVKKRRRTSSDLGSSSDHGPDLTPRTTRKRRKRSTPVPEKRMLTRSQWRRTCNERPSEETACRDEPKGVGLPGTKHDQHPADVSAELYSSNTESSVELSSAALSQQLGSPHIKRVDSTSPEPLLEAASISDPVGQSDNDQSKEPPKLSYMEASVTSCPSQLSHVRDSESVKSPERTEMFPDLDVSDQEEDRLVICDSEDTQQPASPATCHSDSACALGSSQQQCGAAKLPSPVAEVAKQGVPAAVPGEAQLLAKEPPERVPRGSEKTAENTSAICRSAAGANPSETTSVDGADASAAFPRILRDSILPAAVTNASDRDPTNFGASSSPRTSAEHKDLDVVVIKKEPVGALPVTHQEGLSGAQGGSEEPLDLSVKESTFRPRADIPVGKVHPQMASAHSPVQTNDSPINYSAKIGASGSGNSPKPETRNPNPSASKHGGQSIARSDGVKEDTGSDSIMQRLLLDPNRKPKEPETETQAPVILDVRSLRGVSDSPKDAGRQFRESDIVAEAKSLLSARLAAKQQSSTLQPPKGSTVASVPPMSFPENKLGMTTLETKIMELKKQIHHLTILATYKEKELACISSLRTAKEDALKQLEHKYPGICSVMRDFGSDSATSEPSSSPGMTDVPSIVTQAATATSLSAAGASDSELAFQKKVPLQPPLVPAPRLKIGIPEHESSRRLPSSYEPAHSSTQPAYSSRETKQPAPTAVVAAPAKSAFCVPSATLQGHRGQRLLLPKAPVAQQHGNPAVGTSPRANTSALAPPPASMATWWNNPNGTIPPTEPPSGLSHHLRRDSLREYASPSSPQFQSVPSLSPAVKQLQQGGSAQRQSPGDTSAASNHRRPRESPLSITEGSKEVAAGVSRHPEDFGLSLSPASAASSVGSSAYALNRANAAAANIYNQAMAYSLYQQLKLTKRTSPASQAEASASSASLLEKMKQGLPPSQQQLYQKSLGSLLEQAKSHPTAWEHLNLLLQKGSMVTS